jgi:hypothetical protein
MLLNALEHMPIRKNPRCALVLGWSRFWLDRCLGIRDPAGRENDQHFEQWERASAYDGLGPGDDDLRRCRIWGGGFAL